MPIFKKEKQEFKVPEMEPPIGFVVNRLVDGILIPHVHMGDGKWVPFGGFEPEVPEQRFVRAHQGYKDYKDYLAAPPGPADMDETDARLLMWTNVINLPHGVKRMVARVDEWEARDSKDEAVPDTGRYRLFTPTSWTAEYELITTLGTDGNTYPVYDIDYCDLGALPYHMWDDCLFVPSSSHWHGYEQTPHNWTQFLEKHKKAIPGNEGYLVMNRDKGWCGLRPPWHRKDYNRFEDTLPSRSYNWINFDPSQGYRDQSGKKEDRPMSLAEMFESV